MGSLELAWGITKKATVAFEGQAKFWCVYLQKAMSRI